MAIALVTAAQTASPAPPIGWITDVVGAWKADSVPVSRGDELRPGAVVHPEYRLSTSAGAKWSIHIRLVNGGARDAACVGTIARCGFIALPYDLSPRSSFFNRLIEAARRFVLGHPPSTVNAMQRVGARLPGGSFHPSVLRLVYHELDVAPALVDVRPGVSEARLIPLDRDGKLTQHRSGAALELRLSRHPAKITGSTALRPGLYEIESGSIEPATVLLVDRYHYAEASKAYARVQTAAKGWGTNVTDSDKSEYLRAVLIELGSSMVRQ